MLKFAFLFDSGSINSAQGGGTSKNMFSCSGDGLSSTGSLAAVTATLKLDVKLINMLAVASIASAQLLVGILQLQGELINALAVASGVLAQLILQTSA